mgnify:CR=1 FL=1
MRIWPGSFTLRQWIEKSWKYKLALLLLLAAGLFLCAVLSLCIGSTSLSVPQAFKAVQTGDIAAADYRILVYVRFPRTLAAMLSGIALAVSGVLIQAVLNNALAGPNIIGVNAGAGFAALLAAALFPAMPDLIPAGAFLGALLTGLLIFLLAVRTGAGRLTIVLAGVAVSSILSAGIDAVTLLDPDLAVGASNFMIGGFSGISLKKVFPAGWYILIGLLLALPAGSELNVLSLGEDIARSLGMRVTLVRLFLLAVASVLAGAAVSFSGLLGFVGLLIPHIARRLTGNDNRLLLPSAGMMGGIFVLLCDVFSRVVFAPYELPVGIVMSFLGGPFFLFLLLRTKRRRIHDGMA